MLPIYIPQGIERCYLTTVTERGCDLRDFPFKWFSVTVINDDKDNTVYALFNDQPRANPMQIRPGEVRSKNMNAPLIWRVYLYTDAGKTADVRVETLR